MIVSRYYLNIDFNELNNELTPLAILVLL